MTQLFEYNIQFNVALIPYDLYEDIMKDELYEQMMYTYLCDEKHMQILRAFFQYDENDENINKNKDYHLECKGDNFYLYFNSYNDYSDFKELTSIVYGKNVQQKTIDIEGQLYVVYVNIFAYSQR